MLPALSARKEMTSIHWVYYVSGVVWPWVFTLAGFSAVLGWRPGGWLLVVAVCERILLDLAVGVTAYREVMSRPWPQVPVLTDDDW